MPSNVAELRTKLAEAETFRKIETVPPICPALEGTIVKLGALEHALSRIDSNLEMTNQSLARLSVAIEELTNAIVRK